MAWLAAATPYITAGLSIGTAIGQGNAREQIANIEADQLESQALADKADAIQQAKAERKKSELLKSRVKALSAKDNNRGPDVDRIISDIDEQGEYNAWAALYSGQRSYSSKRYAAKATRSRGASQKNSSYAQAGSTILGEVDNFYG